jgi:hypothetical protein
VHRDCTVGVVGDGLADTAEEAEWENVMLSPPHLGGGGSRRGESTSLRTLRYHRGHGRWGQRAQGGIGGRHRVERGRGQRTLAASRGDLPGALHCPV